MNKILPTKIRRQIDGDFYKSLDTSFKEHENGEELINSWPMIFENCIIVQRKSHLEYFHLSMAPSNYNSPFQKVDRHSGNLILRCDRDKNNA